MSIDDFGSFYADPEEILTALRAAGADPDRETGGNLFASSRSHPLDVVATAAQRAIGNRLMAEERASHWAQMDESRVSLDHLNEPDRLAVARAYGRFASRDDNNTILRLEMDAVRDALNTRRQQLERELQMIRTASATLNNDA